MSQKETPGGRVLTEIIYTAAYEKGAIDPLVFNPGEHSSISDWIILLNGDNRIHTTALAKYIHAKLKSEYSLLPAGQEGTEQGRWILIDYIDVLVNITLSDIREFYELDTLYDEKYLVDPASL